MKKLAINPSNKKYYSDDYIKGWEDGVNAQYEATKDAVEVVRCKDCMRYMMKQADAQSVNAEKGESHDERRSNRLVESIFD